MPPTGGVFVSWGSPDAAEVRPLVERLKRLGIAVWEYSEDMPAGARIQEQVMDVINDVRVALVCFSDATARRPWIETEVAWAIQAQRNGNQPLQHVIPVWVGPHPDNLRPTLIEQMQYVVLDVSDASDAAYTRLVNDVAGKLGAEAPIIVPAALYAMTAAQSTQLFDGWKAVAPPPALHAMCSLLGMGGPPPLYDLLLKRYGVQAEDLTPFASQEPITETIGTIVASVNKQRAADERNPLYLRWVHRALSGEQGMDAQGEARDQWLQGDSLLIVDSISTLHPDINRELQGLPELTQTAVVWLPPYTQHMVQVEPELARTVAFVGRLGDEFRRLEQRPERAVTFDAGTPLAVRLWLRRTLAAFSDEPVPQADLIRSIQNDTAGKRPLRRMLRTG
jgi:hypothetical protein